MSLTLMYITNRTDVALVAEKYGVDRIWVDLETLGKESRQKNFDSVKNHHTVEDVRNIRSVLSTSELMVRVNPWNDNSVEEIEAVIDAGADVVMLPMWETASEAKAFIDAVSGRAKVSLLLETKGAEASLDEVLKLKGIDEIHIGLNDLHIQYGLRFMFELLANGKVDEICNKISSAGIRYGFGGVGVIGQGTLPAEYIVSEHYRLKSSQVILSRSFCDTAKISDIDEIENIFSVNVRALRDYENTVSGLGAKEYVSTHEKVKVCVTKIVTAITA